MKGKLKELTAERLRDLYWKQCFSTVKIAKMYHASKNCVRKKMLKLNIKRRTPNVALKLRKVDWMKGKPKSEITKQRLREAQLGKYVGEKNPFYGKKHTTETKMKISAANSGENSALWQGGTSFVPYGPEFNRRLKNEIKERDNHTCQECGYNQEQLESSLIVHHIDYDKKNSRKDNLITLCRSCHLKTGYDRRDWIDYFQNKMETQRKW